MISEILGAAAEAVTRAWKPIAQKSAGLPTQPRVLVLASLNPPRTLGLWEQELIAAAGGVGLADTSAHDLSADELAAFAPELIVIADPDEDDEAGFVALSATPGWFTLPAVQNHEIYLVAPAYLSEAGEELGEAARVLATILHADVFTEMLPPFSVELAPLVLFTPPSPDETQEPG